MFEMCSGGAMPFQASNQGALILKILSGKQVYIFIYLHIYKNICIHSNIYIYVHTYIYVQMYMCIYILYM